MLIRVPLHIGAFNISPVGNVLNAVLGKGRDPVELQTGFYLIGHWNFNLLVSIPIKSQWPEDLPDDLPSSGVCDSAKQFIDKYKTVLKESERQFAVSFVNVLKSDQPASGGWRWYKWGEYVGTKNPQYEYLYDETDIDQVTTFGIYEFGD